MFKAMDLSDVQVISPSRGRFYKNYFQRENFPRSNYRNNKGRTFLDMDISDYPEFGTFFCPSENNGIDNKRYFIKFSTYNKDYPTPHHNVQLSYELKNGSEELHKSSSFLIYIFFNQNQEWLRFNVDLDSITKISLGENNFDEVRQFPHKKKEQTIYFYLKYPPKIGHKGVDGINVSGEPSNDDENISNDDDEYKNSIKEDEKEKIIKNKNIFNYVQERKNNVQINPCPRRKKNVLFQTSPINFEMHNQFPLDSYPYYYSFPMMKPFTSLSEVSTKFSMPSTKISNNKQPQNTTTNNNINLNINNNSNNKKSHWDSTQYNNNYKNALQIFNSFIPSEKYFESLNKELNNYLLVTNLNITNLKELYDNKLEMIENLLRNSLSDNYEIKFGHYGSFFSDLSIEGSDLDILVYYQKKTEECDFYRDLLTILKQNENEFENICPILTATVPVIKLQIDIRKEIKDKNIKLKNTSYLGEDDLTKIKIDLTCSENEQEFQNSHIVMSYINKSLTEYPQIKSILLFLKRYFKQMNMNKNYTGGLCSYSLFLLVLSFCKCNKQCESSTKLLYYFMENFTYFDYCNYYIDAEKDNCYILKEKNDNNTEKSVSDENSSYDTNYELYEKEEIYIVDPITKNNVAKSSFKVDEIILTFRKAFNLLYYEGWYYDYCSKNNPNENTIIENANELYEDNSSDYMIIKKLFGLKSSRNNFDFYFN